MCRLAPSYLFSYIYILHEQALFSKRREENHRLERSMTEMKFNMAWRCGQEYKMEWVLLTTHAVCTYSRYESKARYPRKVVPTGEYIWSQRWLMEEVLFLSSCRVRYQMGFTARTTLINLIDNDEYETVRASFFYSCRQSSFFLLIRLDCRTPCADPCCHPAMTNSLFPLHNKNNNACISDSTERARLQEDFAKLRAPFPPI